MKGKLTIMILLLLPLLASGQLHTEEVTASGSGDLIVPLGKYQIGANIEVKFRASGGWAEDGGIYHIAADWGRVPVVVFRSESSSADRLIFYSYVAPSSNSWCYLYAEWINGSPGKSSSNNLFFSINSKSPILVNSHGDFSQAVELSTVLSIASTNKNVGIGIKNPDEKLAVNGTIRSKEVKVEATNWPDYVFADDYKLTTLEETAEYIEQNRHLPEVPSAAEMESNGVELGEMNMLLLKKIEELTLHLIRLEQENKEQNQLIKELKEQQND
ncbi:hypothetical protein [Reichenbachiella ulvae]|uniref:Uncharacterized protein n=1 Tax=Reichenbachiella ulvae TaxID=2980104 RepID=A0ABT3CV75_9BACT|nr:hypothetical protein [Reichenbachiella ulvae]MCV9387469.1 hypothetical protein [Reichenbachiella ulvae]